MLTSRQERKERKRLAYVDKVEAFTRAWQGDNLPTSEHVLVVEKVENGRLQLTTRATWAYYETRFPLQYRLRAVYADDSWEIWGADGCTPQKLAAKLGCQ